jgi:acyl-CoA reductase-like NAD-dependent aldehyde dehydrogenase
LIDEAVHSGAKLVMGGKQCEKNGGSFYQPTLIVDVNTEMSIFKEEIFGPVCSIIK